MKKLLSVLLLVVLMICALAGCGSSEPPVDDPAVSTEDVQEIYISLDAFWGTLTFCEDDGNGGVAEWETGSQGFFGTPGQTVAEIVESAGMSDFSWDFDGDVFEGWMVYESIVSVTEDGNEIYDFQRVSGDTLLTTEEMMQQVPTAHDTLYVAKWQSASDRDYQYAYEVSSEETMEFYYLSLYSNEGEIIFAGDPEGIALGGYALVAGDLMADVIGAEIESVKKEGAVFTGWSIYTAADYENVEEATAPPAENEMYISLGSYGYQLLRDYQVYSENATTEELTSIICEAKHYFAIPNFAIPD